MQRKAGLYLRQSEDRTGEGLAVDRQRHDGRALITARGWELVVERVDNDTSAAGRKRRPGFEQLMNDVATGRIDTIVALAMDRLSRNRRDDLRIVETCEPNRTLIALVRGSDIDMSTAAGRLVADMMASVARHEIAVKSERHRRQIQQAAQAGLPGGGPRAFGYLRGGLELHPREAPIVEELYHRFLAGASLGELADWLHRNRHTTPRGYRWRLSSIKVVLANPRNAGLRGLRPVVDEATGRRTQWHDIIAPGKWPAIVDEAVWRAAVQRLKDPARGGVTHTRGGAEFRHLLSGIATCGAHVIDPDGRRRVCGLHVKAGSGGGVRMYRCSSDRHIVRRAPGLEAFVLRAMVSRLRRPDAVGLLAQPDDEVGDLDELRGEAMALRARLDGLATDYADGVLTREQTKVAGQRARDRLAGVEERIAELGQVDVLAPMVLAHDEQAAWAAWEAYPPTTKRLVISKVMRIEVLRARPGRPPAGMKFDPDSVRITWRRADDDDPAATETASP